MEIKIGKSVKKITVRPCKPDGLFEALWFQAKAEDYDYGRSAVREFKDEILGTIADDEEYYELFIEEHLLDLNVENYFRASDDDKKFMRDDLMKRIRNGSEWGGSETITAVKDMYEVNFVIFDMKSRTFFMPNFVKTYHGIVFVTFEIYKHYDTIIDIKEEDIPEIARELAKRVV